MPDGHRHQAPRDRTQLVRRGAQVLGILGGLAWVAAWYVWDGGDDPVELALFWTGAALVTLFLLELGTLLVKRGLLALRLFVACALPLLFWMVISFAATSASDDGIVWGLAGVAVAVFAAVLLVRAPRGATL
jgi:hypothetical protein